MKEISIIIKTFERKNALFKLLKSIEKYYPSIKILIVDDSKKNYKKFIKSKFKNLDINYIVTNYDIGLSSGRNILINNVTTKYFVLCDDDFEFDDRTNLDLALEIYKESNANILGGVVYNRLSFDSVYSFLWVLKDIKRLKKIINKEEFISIYNGKFTINKKNILLNINSNFDDYTEKKYYKTDICSNFFLAETSLIKNIGGWTPELLKVGEHETFFLKAKEKNIKVFFSSKFGVVHYPKKTMGYMAHRFKAEQLFKKACELNELDSFFIQNQSKVIYSFKKDNYKGDYNEKL